MPRNNRLSKIVGLTFCLLISLTVAVGVRHLYGFLNYQYLVYFGTYQFTSDDSSPQIGETIVLDYLNNKKGQSFLESSSGKLILLGVIDPDCAASKVAQDQISWAQKEIQNSNVEYALVSFTFTASSEEFFKYTDSFDLPIQAFIRTNRIKPSPASLETMVVPSHILIDSTGKILKLFPGTNKDKLMRRKMATQIVRDSLEEADKITR